MWNNNPKDNSLLPAILNFEFLLLNLHGLTTSA